MEKEDEVMTTYSHVSKDFMLLDSTVLLKTSRIYLCVPYYLGYQQHSKNQEFICNLAAVPWGFGLV